MLFSVLLTDLQLDRNVINSVLINPCVDNLLSLPVVKAVDKGYKILDKKRAYF
jgi:hypothetical protein